MASDGLKWPRVASGGLCDRWLLAAGPHSCRMRLLHARAWALAVHAIRRQAVNVPWPDALSVPDDHSRPARACLPDKLKLTHLTMEDTFEALVHVAHMKALPTDEEVLEAGALDGGDFLLKLRETPSEYDKWAKAHEARWDEPLRQPVHRAVAMLISFLLRTILCQVSKSHETADEADGQAERRLVVSEQDVATFLKTGAKKSAASGGGAAKRKGNDQR